MRSIAKPNIQTKDVLRRHVTWSSYTSLIIFVSEGSGTWRIIQEYGCLFVFGIVKNRRIEGGGSGYDNTSWLSFGGAISVPGLKLQGENPLV